MNKKQFFLDVLGMMIVPLAFAFILGIFVGMARYEHLHKDFSSTQVHLTMQSEGYHYCPYCGEDISKR